MIQGGGKPSASGSPPVSPSAEWPVRTRDHDLVAQVLAALGRLLNADVSQLTDASRLDASLPGLDSLRLVEMIIFLEEQFDVDLEREAIRSIETVGDLAAYIERRREMRRVSE